MYIHAYPRVIESALDPVTRLIPIKDISKVALPCVRALNFDKYPIISFKGVSAMMIFLLAKSSFLPFVCDMV